MLLLQKYPQQEFLCNETLKSVKKVPNCYLYCLSIMGYIFWSQGLSWELVSYCTTEEDSLNNWWLTRRVMQRISSKRRLEIWDLWDTWDMNILVKFMKGFLYTRYCMHSLCQTNSSPVCYYWAICSFGKLISNDWKYP